MSKAIFAFPLEQQTVAAPDGLPRAIVTLPAGAEVIYLGCLYPSSVVGCVALCPVPEPPAPGMAPQFKDLHRMEFLIAIPGNVLPPEYKFRAAVKTRTPPPQEGAPPGEGLVFLFEKQAPKLMIVTPGARG
jgi:hypothetical protein